MFVNARSALHALLHTLAAKRVWFPSYLCPAILQAVLPERIQVLFYDASPSVVMNSGNQNLSFQASDVVITIDYFGFAADPEIGRLAKSKGAIIVQDASQALLSSFAREQADYVLFSPRKFVGVPDGGVLLASGDMPVVQSGIEEPPRKWLRVCLDAYEKRTVFDRDGDPNVDFYSSFREAERSAPVGAFRISPKTLHLLRTAFDYEHIAQCRRENFSVLLEHLRERALIRFLPADVVPIGFPIVSTRRDDLRQRLIANGVFPPIHWELHGFVPNEFVESHQLSKCILTLPCDQRYSEADMMRIVNLVQSGGVGP